MQSLFLCVECTQVPDRINKLLYADESFQHSAREASPCDNRPYLCKQSGARERSERAYEKGLVEHTFSSEEELVLIVEL